MQAPRALALACALALAAAIPTARAQDVPAAQRMFNQGLAAMQAGNFDKACPALEASHKLDPRPGTVFTLAECEAKRGHIASAVARYDDYFALFARLTPEQQQKQGERERIARAQLDALTPLVPELTLTLPADAPKDTIVRRDGILIAPAMLGVPLPVDPGEHLLTTQAPGAEPTEARVTLAYHDKKRLTLQVKPPPRPVQPPKPPRADTPPPPKRSPVPAVVLGGVALATVAVGAGLIVLSYDKRTELFDLDKTIVTDGGRCVGPVLDARCGRLAQTARNSDTLHNVGVGAFVGAGALVVGALTYMLWPAPRSRHPARTGVQITPRIDLHQGGAILSSTF